MAIDWSKSTVVTELLNQIDDDFRLTYGEWIGALDFVKKQLENSITYDDLISDQDAAIAKQLEAEDDQRS